MSSTFIDKVVSQILAVEGGYVNNPRDSGGETNFGITVAVARANGYPGHMKDMPRAFAERVYKERYYYRPKFDRVAAISQRIAEELIDTGVNMGTGVASTYFQRWLNGLRLGCGYEKLHTDGAIGTLTLEAFEKYMKRRGKEGEQVLFTGLNCTQGNRYLELTESREKDLAFLYGWMRNRVVL